MKHNYCHLPVHEWCCSIVNKRNLYLLNRNGLILHTKSPPPQKKKREQQEEENINIGILVFKATTYMSNNNKN